MNTEANTITVTGAPAGPLVPWLSARDLAGLAEQSQRAPRAGDRCWRTFPVDAERRIDEDARTVELAFSSEEPVERFFGTEVLVHEGAAVRLDRLNGGAALLVNHDSDQQVGVVESARLGADRKGRATVRFGRSARAQEIWQDVVDGIRRQVSVGYLIHNVEENSRGDVRVTDWEPLEISIVAVPADAGVGIGRSHPAREDHQQEDTMSRETTDALEQRDETQSPAVEGDSGEDTTERNQAPPDRTRTDARIRELGARYPALRATAETLVDTNGSIADMERAVREHVINTPVPEPTASARAIHVTGGAPRYRKLRGAWREMGEEAAYRSGMWARAMLFNDGNALRWCRDHHVRVMTGTTTADGGALVPDEMSQVIIDNREDFGVMRRIARVVPMDSDTLTVPRRTGGVTAYFSGREEATTASDKTWDQVNLVARELSALTRFSIQYAEDAVIDIAMDLADEMAYAFADKEDDCALNGDGTSTYGGIVGIRTLLIDANHTAGIVTADSGVDTYAEMDSTDLANLRAKLPEYAAGSAVWLFSKAGKNVVIDPILAAGGGNSQAELAGRLVPGYLGDPVVVSQKMPTSTGDLSDVIMALHGDFNRACTLGDRRGFSLQVLRERYAEFRQIGVIGTERFDFVAHDLGDTSDAGPVVGFKGN